MFIKHNILDNKMKTQLVFWFFISFFANFSNAQPTFTDETILWTCPIDKSITITYRMNNYTNIIEINGPFNMDTSVTIVGNLKISDGSFVEPKQLSVEEMLSLSQGKNVLESQNIQQSKEITIKEQYYSEQFIYYNTNVKPIVLFEGNCKTAQTKQLDDHFKNNKVKKLEDKKDTVPKIKPIHNPNSPKLGSGTRG